MRRSPSPFRSLREHAPKILLACCAVLVVWQGARAALERLDHEPSEAARLLAAAHRTAQSSPRQAAATYEAAAAAAGPEESDIQREAGRALASLYPSLVRAPIGEHLDDALAIVRRYAALPALARTEPGRGIFTERMEAWIDAFAEQRRDPADALKLADALTSIDAEASVAFQEARGFAVSRVVDRMPPAPVLIARMLRSVDNDVAAARVAVHLISLEKSTAALRAIGDLDAWLRSHHVAESTIKQVATARGAAVAEGEDPARQRVLAEGELAGLRRWLAAHPGDVDAVEAIAQIELDAGDVRGAYKTLCVTAPGALSLEGQLLRARVLAADGSDIGEWELDATFQLYHGILAHGRRQLELATEAVHQAWIDRSMRGDLPDALQQALAGKEEAAQQAAFDLWVGEQIEADARVLAARQQLADLDGVVELAIALGGHALARASADPENAARHLAIAERALLGIQGDAGEDAHYQLSLGVLHHRLGRAEAGDAALAAVLAQKDPELDLEVVTTYRSLGLETRAREIATAVEARGEAPHASRAAIQLYLMAVDLDERKRWLERADKTAPFVRDSLDEVDGHLLMRAGDLDAADAAFGRVATRWEARLDEEGAAANNAALLYGLRHDCTGDERHLQRARELIDRAVRRYPSDAIVVHNAAVIHQELGERQVLSAWLDVRALRGSAFDDEVFEALLAGPLGLEVRAAMARNPEVRRGRALLRQAAVLGPHRRQPLVDLRLLYARTGDLAAMRMLRDDLRSRAVAFDTDANPSADDALVAAFEVQSKKLAAARERVAAVPSRAATLAVIALLDGDAQLGRAWITGGAADAEAGIARLRQAVAAWPALAGASTLRWGLLQGASARAPATTPALAPIWADRRDGSAWGLAHAVLAAGPDVRAALAATPEIIEAVAVARAHPGAATSVDWVLGELTGADLPGHAAWRSDEWARVRAEIDTYLDPKDEDARLVLAALEGRR